MKAKFVSVINKINAFFMKHKRKIIQVYAALLYNVNIKGYITGDIFAGSSSSKGLCVPGLNCYSCPGAIGACPLGSLQKGLTDLNKGTLYYVIGIILLFGLICGRFICGWLCPVGLGQELLYKIKTPKVKKSNVTYVLSYLKYVVLFVTVVISIMYALNAFEDSVPAFCKYFCPAGTLEGAIFLLASPNQVNIISDLGLAFTIKFIILIILAIASIFIYRSFCRFFCPLGALYSLFNKFCIFGVKINDDKCTHCGKCLSKCKMDIRKVGDHECIQCGECISVCDTQAIMWKGSKPTLNLNKEVEVVKENKEEIVIPSKEITSKDNKKKLIINGALIITMIGTLTFALVYANSGMFDKPSVTPTHGVGVEIPDFEVSVLKGEGTTFKMSEHLGNVVVINFWQTTCASCLDEMTYFNEVYKEYKSEVDVVAIHTTLSGKVTPMNCINSRFSDYEMTFLMDNLSEDGTSAYTYDMLGGTGLYPYTLIVDKNGVIQYESPRSMTYELLKSEVTKLL